MSDLQRTRVHCFLLEENFPFTCWSDVPAAWSSLATNESLLVTREATPSGGKPKSLHRSPPSQRCHAARGRCGLSVRANSSSLGGAAEDSSRPIQSFATGQCSRIAESPPRCPSPRRRTAARRRTTIVQRRGKENKRRSISHDRGPVTMPQANAAVIAGGRQPHGTLCSLTRVSI